MREIKFRGKRVDNGEWVYGNLFKCEHKDSDSVYIIPFVTNGSFTINTLMLNFISPCYEVDPKTVGQYTSLKDRNGKEIYEGDIVKYKDNLDPIDVHKYKGHVEYGNGSFYITNDFMSSYRWIDYEIEVKGNIHDNPELLEGDEGE